MEPACTKAMDSSLYSCSSGAGLKQSNFSYCRLCASVEGEMSEIFGENGEKHELLEKIYRCLPIKVHPSDVLPLVVCEKCCNKLDICYNFTMTALNADIFLKAKFNIFEDLQLPVEQLQSDLLDSEETEEIFDPIDHVVFHVSMEDDENIKIVKKRVINSKSGYCSKSDEEDSDVEFPILNVKGPAVCDICDSKFSDMDEFDDHMSSQHLLMHKWQCHVCDVSFRESLDLLNHKMAEHSGDIVSCNKCSSLESNSMDLDNFDCIFCEAAFKTRDALKMHNCGNSNYGEKMSSYLYRCRACEEIFPNEDLFRAHIRLLRSSPVVLTCKVCFKRFCESEKLETHIKIHDTERRDCFKCQVCCSEFGDASSLSKHLQVHTGNKPHMCDLCGRTYDRYPSMVKHRRLHKPVNLWEFSCSQCGRYFETHDDMKAHITRAHETVNVSKSESEIGGVKNINKKSKFKWVCRYCGKHISTKLSLQDHERIHTGLKPFICEWCGREFRSRPNLLQHHLTHTGDRRHTCDVCGKKFSRKSFIAQHMRVHTGEKPYQCSICGHRFTQAGDMRRHQKRHAEVNPLENVKLEHF